MAKPHEDDAADTETKGLDALIKAFDINGLDMHKGITLSGGSPERYLETLDVLYRDGLDKISKIKTCLKSNDIPSYTIYVHALKSAAANIGADELSASAKALEAAGNNNDLNYIETHNALFLPAFESLLSDIHSRLTAYREDTNNAGVSLDMEVFIKRLPRLKLSLEALDTREMYNTMNILLNLKLADNVKAALKSISKNISAAEYDEALKQIAILTREIK